MPKQIFKIDQFHGGLSNKTDSKDIQMFQFSTATGCQFDTVGKTRTIGIDTFKETIPSTTVTKPGTMLFTFSTDYSILTSDNTLNTASTVLDTHVIVKTNLIGTPHVYFSANGYTDAIPLGGTGQEVTYFYNNGGLRWCDGLGERKGLSFIDRTDFGQYSLTGWHELDRTELPNALLDGSSAYLGTTVEDTAVVSTNLAMHCAYEGNAPEAGDASEGTWTKHGVHLFYTWLLGEGDQETTMKGMGSVPYGKFQGEGATQEEGTASFRFAVYHGLKDDVANLQDFDKRIKGARVYYTTEAEDDVFLLISIDFTKGYMRGMSGTWTDVTWGATANLHYLPNSTDWIEFTDPPKDFTYSFINGHNESDNTDAYYKTVCISGNRAYIGNIIQDGVTYTDRMIKSPLHQLDKFPEGNFLDVAINDGDSIVALESYADRILQFKRRTLYILNTSETSEFVESEHNHAGVGRREAVTKTSFGVVWVNKEGVFLYDGQSVSNLLLGKTGISIDSWDTLMDEPIIGYVPRERKIVVVGEPDNPAGNTYLFDVDTQSWSKANHLFIHDHASFRGVTNFVSNTSTGSCLIGIDNYTDSDTDIQEFSGIPTAGTVAGFDLITKEIDFTQPSSRKKIYKVYVSCKNGANISVTAWGGTDSGYTGTYELGSLTGTSETVWHIDTLSSNISNFSNIKTFTLRFSGTAEWDFEINDISIVYKEKPIK